MPPVSNINNAKSNASSPIGDSRGNGRSGQNLHAAMSTCAGCSVALDSAAEKGCRECPNCKAGESVEGRHFFCSTKCFTSSWKTHRQLHVRVRRTIDMQLEDSLPGDAAAVADFGLMTDEEWRAFQTSSEFTAGMAQKRKWALVRSLDLRCERIKGLIKLHIREGRTPACTPIWMWCAR